MVTIIIILAYFLAVISIGIYSWFKIKNEADYYIAGKNAGFLPVTGSLFATILGSSAILGTIEMGQKTGWPSIWFLLCASFGLLLLVPLSGRVSKLGKNTLPELLGKFYGKKAEKLASVIIPIAWTGIIAAQIIGSAKILSGLNFLDYQYSAIISGTVFVLYTLVGGQLSILKTDLFQSILIIIGIVLLFGFAIQNQTSSFIEPFSFNVLFNDSFKVLDLIILILTYSVTFLVGPDIYSRIFCIKDKRSAPKVVLTVSLLLIPMAFMLTYLGLFSHKLQGNNVLAFANHLLPEWGYALFIVALLSAVMSSADTTLLSSSIILSGLIHGNLENKNALKTTHFLIVVIGMVSIGIALFITTIIQALLFALAVYSGAFVIPILAGLIELKVNKNRVFIAIISGGLCALIGKLISAFSDETIGNLIIVFAFFINSGILFIRLKKNDN